MFFSRNVFGHDEGVDRDYLRLLFGLYQGSTRPPKYLPHQCSHRARLEIVPEPPLRSAQIIPAFRKKDFYVC